MTKSVLVYGSECTGKTILTEQLALHFKAPYIPDIKRKYIAKNDFCFIYEDINKIAELYQKERLKAEKSAKSLIISDSDVITLSIYSEAYFWQVNPNLEKIISKQHFDLILFLNADIPWVSDPSRDYGDNQKAMHKIFRDELKKRKLDYVLIRGNFDKRLATSIDAINKLLKGE